MGLFLPVLPLTLQVSEQMPEPTLGVGKHWGFSEENGANKLKLIMSLKDLQDKKVPDQQLTHHRVAPSACYSTFLELLYVW